MIKKIQKGLNCYMLFPWEFGDGVENIDKKFKPRNRIHETVSV